MNSKQQRTPPTSPEMPSQIPVVPQYLESLINQNASCLQQWFALDNLRKQIYEQQYQIQDFEVYMERQNTQCDGTNDRGQQPAPEQLQEYVQTWRSRLQEMHAKANNMMKGLINDTRVALQHASASKDHLVNVVLYKWKLQQKRGQYSPKEKQVSLMQELDYLDPIFERLGEEMKKIQTLIDQLLEVLQSAYPTENSSQLLNDRNVVSQLIFRFVWDACVVAVQPPPVLMKSRPPQQTGGQRQAVVRPICQPVIRILGGATLGCRVNKEPVTCNLLSEEQAKSLHSAPPQESIHGQCSLYYVPQYNCTSMSFRVPVGTLLNFVAHFETDSQNRHFANFSRITLINIQRPAGGSEGIPRQRYYLFFNVKLAFGGTMMQGGKLSLPVAALVHPRQEFEQGADAYLFWDLAFSEGIGILTDVPRENSAGVPWPVAAEALNLKFQQLVESPKSESKHQLSDIAMNHLASRFFGEGQNYANCILTWEMFFKNDMIPSLKRETGHTVTFREWFYKCAEIVNRKLFRFWNNGLLMVFASKNVSEALMMNHEQPLMIIRFSDSQMECLIISYVNPAVSLEPQHLRVGKTELESVSLDECIKHCPELRNVHMIYPDRQKTDLWKNDDNNGPTKENTPCSTHSYGRRMVISLLAPPPPAAEFEAPALPPNINMDVFDDWLSEQYSSPNQLMEPIPLDSMELHDNYFKMD